MASLGLVADYSSSDDEQNAALEQKLRVKESNRESTNFFETTPDSTPSEKKTKKCKKSKKEKLINPRKGLMSLDDNALPNPFQSDETTSVFYNPFHKEQEAKKLMLEKHVKLTQNPKDVVEINGKKMCFNFRKGRCKFGHKCKFAHDSDLSTDAIALTTDAGATDSPASALYNNTTPSYLEQEQENARKRKPGLSEGLVPNKRARENFRSQQNKEAPWLTKR